MSAVLTNYVRAVSEAVDPRAEIKKWTKGIDKEYVLSGRVIVATYARPAKTTGGIILTDNLRQEDVYQGSCGMIVALSEDSFKYADGGYKFEGIPPKLFDFVIYRAADGMSISYNKASCRILRDSSIMCVTKNPDRWY